MAELLSTSAARSDGEMPRVGSVLQAQRRTQEGLPLRRFIARDRPWNQASGKFTLSRRDFRFFVWFGARPKDWFQFALSLPTTAFILLFVVLYVFVTLLFGLVYVTVHSKPDCDLSENGDLRLSFREAFAFSVETAATIGYGLPNGDSSAFFSTCTALPIVILLQIIVVTLINAALVGILFVRLSRATVKANHIVFSDYATIRCVDGAFHLSFRVGEISFFTYHPVLTPQVSAYALMQTPPQSSSPSGSPSSSPHLKPTTPPLPPPVGFASAPHADVALPAIPLAAISTRLSSAHPPPLSHSTLGEQTPFAIHPMGVSSSMERRGAGQLFLAVPQVISHSIDSTSPLYPPSDRLTATDRAADRRSASSSVPARDADAGEGAAGDDSAVGRTQPEGHAAAGGDDAGAAAPETAAEEQTRLLALRTRIAEHMSANHVEVMVALEATDPLTGNPFMARHSYTSDEIVWEHALAPGIVRRGAGGKASVDWDRFHTLTAVSFNEPLPTGVEELPTALSFERSSVKGADNGNRVNRRMQDVNWA